MACRTVAVTQSCPPRCQVANAGALRLRCAPQRAAFVASRKQRSRAVPVQATASALDQQPQKKVQWENMWRYLVMDKGFESTAPQECKALADAGKAVLIDVRPANRYNEAHAEGAINVPLYMQVQWGKPDAVRYLRALAMMANGVEPVEPNATFLEDLKQAADGKGVVLMCEVGGTLASTASFHFGKTSRSLIGCYQAMQQNLADPVVHMRGGVYGWFRAGLPLVGEYDASNIGRTPSVVEETTFAYGRKVDEPGT